MEKFWGGPESVNDNIVLFASTTMVPFLIAQLSSKNVETDEGKREASSGKQLENSSSLLYAIIVVDTPTKHDVYVAT